MKQIDFSITRRLLGLRRGHIKYSKTEEFRTWNGHGLNQPNQVVCKWSVGVQKYKVCVSFQNLNFCCVIVTDFGFSCFILPSIDDRETQGGVCRSIFPSFPTLSHSMNILWPIEIDFDWLCFHELPIMLTGRHFFVMVCVTQWRSSAPKSVCVGGGGGTNFFSRKAKKKKEKKRRLSAW